MDPAADNIFPFILALLNEKPFLFESQKSLLKELRNKFKDEDMNYKNLKKDFDEALEIGQNMGILRVVDDKIYLPFSLDSKKESRSKSLPAADNKNKKSTKQKALTDKERRSRRRRSSSNRTKGSRTRSRSRSSRRAISRRRTSRRGSRK